MELLTEKWKLGFGYEIYSSTLKGKDGDGVLICDLYKSWQDADTEELDTADLSQFASLIAAAPEMYRILKKIEQTKKASLTKIRTLLDAIERGC